MTELRQVLTLALHAEACGCSEFIGVGDEDDQYEKLADAVLRVLAEHGDSTAEVRIEIRAAIESHTNEPIFPPAMDAVMAIVAPHLARAEAAEAELAAERQQLVQVRAILSVLREFIHPDQGNAATPYGDGERYVRVRDLEQVLRIDASARPADANLARAEAAEAEVQRLAAARLVIAVFGVPETAPQPFALHRGDARQPIALGVQWPGGAVSIKWTPPERLAVVTSHSLADALTVYDPDGTLSVVWLSEDLGTLAEAEERARAAEARLRDGLTDREREVFVKLVQFVDREHWYASNDCHPVRGDDCETWCPACEVLRHVDDQLLREAREAGGYARP